MDQYSETFETWNKLALQYEAGFMELECYNATYDFMCKSIIKTNPKILEIGCGPGNITKYLLSKRPDFEIFGIDIAPNMIELARKNNPAASFAIMDCRKIDVLKTKYDGIVCGFCLPYLSNDEVVKLINDCHVLLNQKGLIYLSFVEGDPDKSGFHAGSSGDRIYFYYHNLGELIIQLKQRNFDEIETFKIDYKRSENEMELHTIVVAKKITNA